MEPVASASGFFLSDGLIITTYNFLEDALMHGQGIIISDYLDNVYELEGIVTMDDIDDVAILKLKQKNGTKIDLPEKANFQKEDAVIPYQR